MKANSSLLRGTILLGALLLLTIEGKAQDEHVYLIKMFDCTHLPSQRSQTGFRVRGMKGIVTALHGVADCRRVMARSLKGPILDQPLNIVKTDIDRDMALLSSPQLEQDDGGIERASTVVWESLGTVRAYGHPYGIGNLETTLTLRHPPLVPLKTLIPDEALSAFIKRQSPSHLIKVVSLQGPLLPGHSGAPILDASGRVVAVANGGLKGGFASISWAVPFQDIEWDSPTSRLKDLTQIDPNILFANDAASNESISDEMGNDFCAQISKVIAASRTGFFPIIGDPISERAVNRFKSKLELPGTFSSIIEPQEHVTYGLREADTLGKIESQYYNFIATLSKCLPGWKQKETMPPNHVLSATPSERRVLQPARYRRHLFREKNDGVTVEIYYSMDGRSSGQNRILWLSVYTPGRGNW
jgi:hypothetical protein